MCLLYFRQSGFLYRRLLSKEIIQPNVSVSGKVCKSSILRQII